MNFSFLSPFFLIGLAALALPIIAHLISRKSGAVKKFPAVTFLLASRGDSAVRSRLKDFLLLLLRALVIALLVLVFARPSLFSFAPAGNEGPRSVAVVVDNSFSMGYGDHFNRAVKTARDMVSSLPDGSFAIVAPLVSKGERLTPLRDRAGLRRAADEIELTASWADNEKRLSEVYAALSDSPPEKKEVVFLTDMQKNGWRESPAPRDWLRVVDVTEGEESPNRAVTEASASRGKDETTLEIGVSNFSPDEARELLARVDLDGREVNGYFDIKPHEKGVREFTLPPDGDAAAPGHGTASIEKDNLPVDDTRYFVLSGGEGAGVLIVDGDPREEARLSEAYYLAGAGETISEISGTQVTVKDNEAFLSEDLSPYGVIFLANVGDILPSNAESLKEFVTGGGTLVIFTGERIRPSSYNALLKELLPGQLLTVQEAGTFVSAEGAAFSSDVRERLGSVRVGRHFSTYPEEGSETILSTASGDPFLLRKGLGGGSVYLFTSTADTSWSDLPISPVFLPIVKELMDTSGNSGVRKRSYLAGEIAAIDVPPGSENIEVSGPGGEKTPVSGANPVFAGTDTTGIYTVTQGGKSLYSFSVNVDPAESDLSRITIESAAPGETGQQPGFVKVFSELWRYFLWGAIALFISEAAVRALFS